MTIDLSKVVFDNDFYSVALPDGLSTLILNRLNEDFATSDSEFALKIINFQIEKEVYDETSGESSTVYTKGINVIGLSNNIYGIHTNHSEYEGTVLTEDNMKYCTLEIYE